MILYCCLLFRLVLAQYVPAPRWAQAVALLDNTLYVHGGLSDQFNSYSYSSAPAISDLLVLDLSTSFNSSSPPWQLLSTTSSPALGWHTLSTFNTTDLFLYGGQPDPDSSTVLTTLNDSAGILSTSGPSFSIQHQNWANEPMRRIRHSASFTDGKVWIIGGEEADGSGNAFSQHYSFSPSTPMFVPLPSSSSAPPDIYGHASFVLPDGRLMVLGGYCASCSELVPMNTVWSLITTHNPPIWEKLFTSNTSLPNPRRDFAAVVLSDGLVLVHGGGDAQLQMTYSDGWILDTGQNPMVWESVQALSQLGERKDHFAVQAGNHVLFCFGYGTSSPASASLFIYDPTSSSMVTSYNAPSPGSTPAIASLPAPTRTGQTGSNPNSDGGAGAGSPSTSGTPSQPSGSSSGSSNRTTTIALGTVFGVIGLVASGLAAIYYARRMHDRHRRSPGGFFALADDPEVSQAGSEAGAAPEVAHLDGPANERARGVGSDAIKDILVYLGIDKFNHRPGQPRMDMFADEDIRSFGWVGHSGTVQRDSVGSNVWSFRSVSALVRGVISREPSGIEVEHEWEKIDHIHEGKDGLTRQSSLRSEYSSHQRRDGSFWSYTDPVEDPGLDDEYDLNLHTGTPEKDADYDFSIPISDETSAPLPFSVHSRVLTPLREACHPSLSDPSNSLPSLQESSHGQTTSGHIETAALSPSTSISPTCYSPTASPVTDAHLVTAAPQHSPLLGSTLSRSPSISRPDSWWTRLTKSPLLDRHMSITSAKPLDFRDPTPAPLLGKLEEMATFESSESAVVDTPAEHGRSLSSAHSGRTANTDFAERLGGKYDVVQRLPSDGSGLRHVLSLGSAEITEQWMYAVNAHARSEISLSSNAPHADPPHSTLSPAGPAMTVDEEVPAKPLGYSKSNPTSQTRGTVVTSRVREYERKMSEELESQQILPPRNTRRREEIPSRTRPTIQYGVAPRASLYIANPDLGLFP